MTGAFAVAWNGFVAFWTIGALASGGVLMGLFSLPFWAAGFSLARWVLFSLGFRILGSGFLCISGGDLGSVLVAGLGAAKELAQNPPSSKRLDWALPWHCPAASPVVP